MSEIQVQAMEGIEPSPLQAQTRPLFTPDEARILEVYDRLEELQFEIALLKVQGVLSDDGPIDEDVSEEDITTAQRELLEAKATYHLRNNVVERVLTTNPILRAVHAGTNTSTLEQDLLPLIHARDIASITLTKLRKEILTTTSLLQKAEISSIALARENASSAEKMLALAAQANTQPIEDIDDERMRERLREAEEDMKSSRRKWRIIKGTAAATVVGSGVDWAGDEKLVDIVLDSEG